MTNSNTTTATAPAGQLFVVDHTTSTLHPTETLPNGDVINAETGELVYMAINSPDADAYNNKYVLVWTAAPVEYAFRVALRNLRYC